MSCTSSQNKMSSATSNTCGALWRMVNVRAQMTTICIWESLVKRWCRHVRGMKSVILSCRDDLHCTLFFIAYALNARNSFTMNFNQTHPHSHTQYTLANVHTHTPFIIYTTRYILLWVNTWKSSEQKYCGNEQFLIKYTLTLLNMHKHTTYSVCSCCNIIPGLLEWKNGFFFGLCFK